MKFLKLDDPKYSSGVDEDWYIPNGAMSVRGSYTNLKNTVNVEFDDKKIKICTEEQGVILEDGGGGLYNKSETINYTFHLNGSSTSFTTSRSQIQNHDIYYNNNVLLEEKDLKTLVNKEDLSHEDLMVIGFNLSTRQSMPESIRNFSTFADLRDKIYNSPDKLEENMLAVFDALIKIARSKDKNHNAHDSFQSLLSVVNNLEYTENHDFNAKFRRTLANIMDKYRARDFNDTLDEASYCFPNSEYKTVCNEMISIMRGEYYFLRGSNSLNKELVAKKKNEEMNNLKVLGLIQDHQQFHRNHGGFVEAGADKFNILLVEDVKNKARYYIHLNCTEIYKYNEPNRVTLTVERAEDEKLMTHLPKGKIFIKGFAINPKTLDYTHDTPREEYIYKGLDASDFVFDLNDLDGTIANNVFSCRLKEGLHIGAHARVNENLFTPNPDLPISEIIETNKLLKTVRKKLHKDKTANVEEDKKTGNTRLNKMLMKEKLLNREDDKLALKRPGKTNYNKSLMKILRNRNSEESSI